MRKLSRTAAGNAVLIASAGVYTSPDFMTQLCRRVAQLLEERTRLCVVRAELSFPYGDWHGSLLRQIRQVGHDMRLNASTTAKIGRSIGGRRLIEQLGDLSGIDFVLLLGHSGGGVASIHAAYMLGLTRPELHVHTVQIGCPRSPIPPQLRDQVHYLFAVDSGKTTVKDPVCRLGSWGGWDAGLAGLPRWNRLKQAPPVRTPVPIVGNHPDYFRDHPPFLGKTGQSNLDILTGLVMDELLEKEFTE